MKWIFKLNFNATSCHLKESWFWFHRSQILVMRASYQFFIENSFFPRCSDTWLNTSENIQRTQLLPISTLLEDSADCWCNLAPSLDDLWGRDHRVLYKNLHPSLTFVDFCGEAHAWRRRYHSCWPWLTFSRPTLIPKPWSTTFWTSSATTWKQSFFLNYFFSE